MFKLNISGELYQGYREYLQNEETLNTEISHELILLQIHTKAPYQNSLNFLSSSEIK